LLSSATLQGEHQVDHRTLIRSLQMRKEELEAKLAGNLAGISRNRLSQLDEPQQLAKTLPQHSVLVDIIKYDCHASSHIVQAGDQDVESRFMAFVLTSAGVRAMVPLGDADDLEQRARHWHQSLAEGLDTSDGHRLWQELWVPIEKYFPPQTRTVYLVPDGELSLVPWNALPCDGGARLLIEQYAILNLPHAPFLLEQLLNPAAPDPMDGQLLAVGDLDFGVDSRHAAALPFGIKQFQWRRLEGSLEELEAIVSTAGPRSVVELTGKNASRELVLHQLAKTRWAHFATHGFFLDQQMLERLMLTAGQEVQQRLEQNASRMSLMQRSPFICSGLALSNANQLGPIDEYGLPVELVGILTAEEVAAIDGLGLDLVVLSACESARGEVVHGDGQLGIQTAFHLAGARNVVASLWKVDDQATADLMADFYRAMWCDGQTPADALRTAQLQQLRRQHPAQRGDRGPDLATTTPLPRPTRSSKESYQWAAFALSGPGF
jgi:CHAT domain-containing protein